jgi:uncharacterized protein
VLGFLFGRQERKTTERPGKKLNRDLEQLVELQAIELEVRHVRTALEAVPRRVAAAEKARADADMAKATAEKALAKEEVLRRSQESDAESQRVKIVRLRKQMDAAVSGAQITALEHEIGFAEKAIAKLEDEEIGSLERTDTLDLQKAEAGQSLVAAEAALESERTRAAEVTESHRVKLAELEVERSAIRKAIADHLLANFDRVAKSRGTGIAEALDGKCSACQMKLRPQRWNDLTGREHVEDVFTCETCGRILFWDPRRDAPGEWKAGDRLVAAIHGGAA